MSRSEDNELESELEGEATEAELAEAAALAQILERGTVREQLPSEDALEAAALLQLSRHPELDGPKREAIWAELAEQLDRRPVEGTDQRGASFLRWLLWLAPAAGVAVLVVYLGVGSGSDDALQAVNIEIPAPSKQLLRVQARLIDAPTQHERDTFDEQMGHYREQVYASLEASHR